MLDLVPKAIEEAHVVLVLSPDEEAAAAAEDDNGETSLVLGPLFPASSGEGVEGVDAGCGQSPEEVIIGEVSPTVNADYD